MINKMKEKNPMQKGIKTAILILSVLLAVSVVALAGTLIYRSVKDGGPEGVTVPDNIITPDAVLSASSETASSETETTGETGSEEASADTASPSSDVSDDLSSHEAGSSEASAVSTASSAAPAPTPASASSASSASTENKRKAAVISLYQKHAEDNQPFQASNMFPGDAETKYFCVRISHSGDVVVHYRADVRPGYEKLAEVLRCRVVLMTTGETLYDGLMRDMPESLKHSVETDTSTESELYYGITAYLNTDVGNAYQNQDLIADFRWWVQDTENLDTPPTGDSFRIYLWIALASGSLLILLLLVKKRRREECENV